MRASRYIGFEDRNAKRNRKFFEIRFSKISDSLKFKIPKRQKFVLLDRAIEQLFGAGSLRTVKSRLNSLEGRARRRCFPFVARYPLPMLLLTLGTPARPRVFPKASPSEPRARPPHARCPQRVRGGCGRRGAPA
jgi:hypothetical protein